MLVLSICDFCYIFVQTIGLLSLLCNFTLISLFFACPLKKVKSYKFFFLLTAINDVFISITHGLSLPRVVYMKSYFIIYSTPTLGQPVMVNWIALIMLALSITATVVLLTYSFIYRYLQLCRSDYLEPFLIKKTMMSLALLGVVYPSNVWIFLIVVYSHDSQFVIDTQEVSSIVGVDINNAVIIGFSLKKSLNGTQKAVTIEIYLFTFIMFMISAICALNIASFLKNSTLSKTSLAHYRRMFFLLLVQDIINTILALTIEFALRICSKKGCDFFLPRIFL
ncbi:hypothetical protein Q1695_007335 [Nippostrongylus brasiliensis]|nr:hypothetical protein Q1695_007335 [Nippostrongylus brasiliensis]